MNDALLRTLSQANRMTAAGNDVISAPEAGSHKAPDMRLANVSRAQFQKHRILCVDDEIVGTKMRAEVLRHQGYSVDLYHSAVAALRCDVSMFELAILDFEMPELNGRELLLGLRALGARFPTVLLTGRLEELSHEDRVLFARCLDKGMPSSRLLDVVTELLDQDTVPDYGS
jgi:CheY-like chemotaxis protein